MKELVKKGFLLGLGAVSLTRKKAQKIVNELVKKKIVSKRDGVALLKRILKEANDERKRIESIIIKEVGRELKKAGPLIKKAKLTSKKTEKIGKQVAKKVLIKTASIAQKKIKEAFKKIKL